MKIKFIEKDGGFYRGFYYGRFSNFGKMSLCQMWVSKLLKVHSNFNLYAHFKRPHEKGFKKCVFYRNRNYEFWLESFNKKPTRIRMSHLTSVTLSNAFNARRLGEGNGFILWIRVKQI